jgi:hypothetical protein
VNRLLTATLIALFALPAAAHAADDGTYPSGTVSPASLTGSTSWGDVNGDAKADYCRVTAEGQPTGQYSCTLSTGRGFGATASTPAGNYDAGYGTARLWETSPATAGPSTAGASGCRRPRSGSPAPRGASPSCRRRG